MRIFDKSELESRVDEILYYKWDPIGVSHEPCARWEYKSYVASVLGVLLENDHAAVISDHLDGIIANSMGLRPNKQHSTEIAELLLQHKRAVAQGLA